MDGAGDRGDVRKVLLLVLVCVVGGSDDDGGDGVMGADVVNVLNSRFWLIICIQLGSLCLLYASCARRRMGSENLMSHQ